MKKIITIMLIAVFTLSFGACKKEEVPVEPAPEVTEETVNPEAVESENTEPADTPETSDTPEASDSLAGNTYKQVSFEYNGEKEDIADGEVYKFGTDGTVDLTTMDENSNKITYSGTYTIDGDTAKISLDVSGQTTEFELAVSGDTLKNEVSVDGNTSVYIYEKA